MQHVHMGHGRPATQKQYDDDCEPCWLGEGKRHNPAETEIVKKPSFVATWHAGVGTRDQHKPKERAGTSNEHILYCSRLVNL